MIRETFDYTKLSKLAEYIDRIGAEQLNFRKFAIREYRGKGNAYYKQICEIKLSEDGKITCSDKEHAPTPDEQKAIEAELSGSNSSFPKHIEATNTHQLDKGPTGANGELYELRSRKTGNIIMIQERKKINGEKVFLPWTLWSDGHWRRMEPDCALPFWKPEKATHARIMVHEGAKKAYIVDGLVRNKGILPDGTVHPWYETLRQFEHWGMIGGAKATYRADYDELHDHQPTEVIYVCDNDDEGKAAIETVSRCYGGRLKVAMFDSRFEPAWDLANPLPDEFFKQGIFTGPPMESFISSATRATKLVAVPDSKKPVAVLTKDFEKEWIHCVTPEVFIPLDYPHRSYTKDEFNSLVRPFSDVDNTARLLLENNSSKALMLKYSPGKPSGLYTSLEEGRCVNCYTPSKIKPIQGDITPYKEYITHLIPDATDRFYLEHFCATLVSVPGNRMLFSVLLVSENGGVGKGTLGVGILAPLLGKHNVQAPSEENIVESNFNAFWAFGKQLCIIHEIYSGHSSKAYNKLKSIITEEQLIIEKKYQSQFSTENHLHILAMSNSRNAIKLSVGDRRWLVPRVTENKKPPPYWTAFYKWLYEQNGLNHIRWYFDEFIATHGPVIKGSHAPMTTMKEEIIEEAGSPGQILVAQILDIIREDIQNGVLPADTFITDFDLIEYIIHELHGGKRPVKLEKLATVRRVARERGWLENPKRIQNRTWGDRRRFARILTLDPYIAAIDPMALSNAKMDPGNRKKPLDLNTIKEVR